MIKELSVSSLDRRVYRVNIGVMGRIGCLEETFQANPDPAFHNFATAAEHSVLQPWTSNAFFRCEARVIGFSIELMAYRPYCSFALNLSLAI